MPLQPLREVRQKREQFAVTQTTPYSDDYRKKLFYIWYENGKPRGQKLLSIVPEDEHGRIPQIDAVLRWMGDDNWIGRAQEMDREVEASLERLAIEQKIAVTKRHLQIGGQLVELGISALLEKGVDTPAEALRAIKQGVDMERQNAGVPEFLQRLSNLSNEQLLTEVNKIVDKMEDEDVIEAEFLMQDDD